MDKTLGLSIVLGAALSAGFQTTIGQSVAQINRVGDAVSAIEHKQGNIDRFVGLKRETVNTGRAMDQARQSTAGYARTLKAAESTVESKRKALQEAKVALTSLSAQEHKLKGTEYRAAQKAVKDLSKELKSSQEEAVKQRRAFENAKREAGQLKQQYNDQRLALQQARSAMDAAGQSTRDLRGQQVQLGRTLDMLRGKQMAVSRAMSDRKAIIAARAGYRAQMLDAAALAAAIAGPVKQAMNFESAMVGVKKTVNFDNQKQFVQLGRAIRKMATEDVPMAASGLAEITAAAGQAGIPRGELAGFTHDAAQIGVAWDMAAGEAGKAVTGLRNIFHLNQKDVVLLADSYNYMSNNMDAFARDILNVANRAGSTGKLFGLSGQQVGALGAAFLQLKTPPSVASNAINGMLNRLATADRQTDQFKKALNEIGWTATDLKDAIHNDAQGALVEFLKSVKGAEDVQGVLLNLFGLEYSDDVAKLVGGLDTYQKAIGMISDKTKYAGAVQKEYRTAADTAANQTKLFSNKVSDLAIELGNVLLPPLNQVLTVVGAGVMAFSHFAQEHQTVTTAVVGLTVGLAALKITTLATGYAWTFVTGAFATGRAIVAGAQLAWIGLRIQMMEWNTVALITAARMRLMSAGGIIGSVVSGLTGLAGRVIPMVVTGFRALSVAVMTNPIGLIVGGIALAAGLVITNWDKVKGFFQTIWKPIKPIWDKFLGWVMTAWNKVGKVFEKIRSWFGGGTKKLEIGATIKQAKGKLKQVAGAAVIAGTVAVPAVAKGQPQPAVAHQVPAAVATPNQTAGNPVSQAQKVPQAIQSPSVNIQVAPAAPAVSVQPAEAKPAISVTAVAPRATASQQQGQVQMARPVTVNMGGVTIQVNAAPGVDVNELADEVKIKLEASWGNALHEVE
ncbi:phage tail tape measure protein [Kordiimonas marina]|uniref:phage tail tape measure protein n=1 Tax=Kordiimonas marina TaxID=2872312 RepID=UPI001FF55D27|nr:phage tail tape measure protein [Kordiimonas marina]MCJ9428537.1 phage tail tape measure protein [Kordiimonas marina]